MDKLAGWSLWHNGTNTCSECGMKAQKNNCCKDEHQPIKLTTAHQKESAIAFAKIIVAPALPASAIALLYAKFFVPEKFFLHRKTPTPKQRLYLRHRVLLI